jgi:copper chaperone CopZ
VSDVKTDIAQHTVTLTFDDQKLSIDEAVTALADAGYVARNPERLE